MCVCMYACVHVHIYLCIYVCYVHIFQHIWTIDHKALYTPMGALWGMPFLLFGLLLCCIVRGGVDGEIMTLSCWWWCCECCSNCCMSSFFVAPHVFLSSSEYESTISCIFSPYAFTPVSFLYDLGLFVTLLVLLSNELHSSELSELPLICFDGIKKLISGWRDRIPFNWKQTIQ